MKKIMMLIVLAIFCIDAKVMQRMRGGQVVSRPVATSVSTPVTTTLPVIKTDQEVIKKRLDQQLSSPVENAWEDRINDLFDLAIVNRESARDYFIKIREKMAEESSVKAEEKPVVKPPFAEVEKGGLESKPVEVKPEVVKAEVVSVEKPAESILPAGAEPMKIGTGKPAPPRKFGAPKVESEVPKAETGEALMTIPKKPAPPKKGPPPGGPKKALTPLIKTAEAAAGKKEEAPKKVVEQIFTLAKVKALEDDKLLALFNDLLEKLGTVSTNWNATIVEKVEKETGHGFYNAYGAPVLEWMNKISTVKRALVEKKIMTEEEASQKIKDRIAQVRSEKNVKPVASAQPEEKLKEELTEEDLVKLIKGLLAEPKTDQIGWAVAIKANIKALDKLNPAAAKEYQDRFIQLMQSKK